MSDLFTTKIDYVQIDDRTGKVIVYKEVQEGLKMQWFETFALFFYNQYHFRCSYSVTWRVQAKYANKTKK